MLRRALRAGPDPHPPDVLGAVEGAPREGKADSEPKSGCLEVGGSTSLPLIGEALTCSWLWRSSYERWSASVVGDVACRLLRASASPWLRSAGMSADVELDVGSGPVKGSDPFMAPLTRSVHCTRAALWSLFQVKLHACHTVRKGGCGRPEYGPGQTTGERGRRPRARIVRCRNNVTARPRLRGLTSLRYRSTQSTTMARPWLAEAESSQSSTVNGEADSDTFFRVFETSTAHRSHSRSERSRLRCSLVFRSVIAMRLRVKAPPIA